MTDQVSSPLPEPLMNGRFTLYATPNGGYHIAWRPDGTDETQHIEVPQFIANMAKNAAEGKLNPATMLKEMMANAPL
jgi:hypothetical protein